jgi:hypothetical protein
MIESISRKELAQRLCQRDEKNTVWIDTYNGAPINMRRFQFLNPFFTWNSPVIPVPAISNLTFSKSVEAIWQGTKYVDKKIDFAQFDGFPYKRPSEEARANNPKYCYATTQFYYEIYQKNTIETRMISQLEARFLIYLVSYLYVLNHLVPEQLIHEIQRHIQEGSHVVFYDWDANMDITNVSESFSHSAILSAWFRNSLSDDFLKKAKISLSPQYYEIFSAQFNRLTTRYQEQK